MARWRAPGGIDVERSVLDGVECLRLRKQRFLLGHCYSLHELTDRLVAYGLTLGDLEPVDEECE